MEIKNAKITGAELTMADHGCLTMWLHLEGCGWGCGFGGYCLGKGYLDATEFEGSEKGLESIMRIMNVVGVEEFTQLKGKYVRAELEGWGGGITRIGHITEDKWFSYKEFFKKESESKVEKKERCKSCLHFRYDGHGPKCALREEYLQSSVVESGCKDYF